MGPPPILFADARFVVLDKPAGLPSHPSRGGGASAEDWFPALSRRSAGPWLAHRLDADTAGCLLVALRRAALLEAQAAFASGTVEKTYWAIVSGRPPGEAGTIEVALNKIRDARGWRMAVGPGGQASTSAWRLRGATQDLAWLEMHPHTGRTHQVRVHCAWLGCPVLGDPIYGAGGGGGPLQLLARAIELPLAEPVRAEAPPPRHMRAALQACGWVEPTGP